MKDKIKQKRRKDRVSNKEESIAKEKRSLLELREESLKTGEDFYELLKREGYISDPMKEFYSD